MATMRFLSAHWVKIFAGDTWFPIAHCVVEVGDGYPEEHMAETINNWARGRTFVTLASINTNIEGTPIALANYCTMGSSDTFGDSSGWQITTTGTVIYSSFYQYTFTISYKDTQLYAGDSPQNLSNQRGYFGTPVIFTDTEGNMYICHVGRPIIQWSYETPSADISNLGYCIDIVGDNQNPFGNFHIDTTPIPNVNFYDISVEISPDPYEWGVGPSEPGGRGDGTFDFSSTPIDFQGLPGIGAMDTGMVSLYVPSASDLRGLAQYLWAGAFDVENFKKLVADPMDTIIGMHIVPLTAAEIGTTPSTLVVGNISTGLSMPKATSQYVAVDCGSITIDRKWGAYLDYSPYSKLQLFLPYIGFVDISPDECMGGTIAVRYSIDILGGTCVAQVKCNDHVLYELSGNCSCEVPVTAGQYQNIALSLTRGIGAIAGGIASGNYAGAVEGVANAALSAVKPEVQRSGGFGGSSGLMGHQIPFLILTVPRLCVPGSQNTYIGYPSFITRTMSELEGYNAVEVSHLENMSCTQAEADMIIAALAEGVIF